VAAVGSRAPSIEVTSADEGLRALDYFNGFHDGFMQRLVITSRDTVLDDLYEKQSRATDAQERLKLLRQFERRVLDEKVYQFHVLWWQRIIPHWKKVKGWTITPSHYLNQDLRDVWLAPE
jgi:ABC-type transport system substrate-binding protein